MGRSFTWFPTEGGGCLTSKFAEELYKALQTNNLVTAAYHSQMNGLVERFNHTFAEMLSMNFSSCHDDWDEIVDFMVFSYNTSRQESTGVTPFYSLYGRKATLPMDVALGNNPNFADGKKTAVFSHSPSRNSWKSKKTINRGAGKTKRTVRSSVMHSLLYPGDKV